MRKASQSGREGDSWRVRKERREEDWVDGRVGTTKKVDMRVSLGMGREVDSYTQLLRPASTSFAYRSSSLLFSQGAQGAGGSGRSDGLLEMQA